MSSDDDLDKKLARAKVSQALFGEQRKLVRIGRYRLDERLGAGAMGVVYKGRDTELDRPVALKLLQVKHRELERKRFVREAKALAKLSHPNVLTVYEVGTADNDLFIATEYVEGKTFREWLQERPRSMAQIVEAMLAAGRGLAAAHEAGLIHRDFKPDNMMIGSDGRVRVLDFGLARLAEGDDAAPLSVATQESFDVGLTMAGAVLGTPCYMSPEQHEGQQVDARTDQYSYCVSLYEALCGDRPYDGESIEELGKSKQRPLHEKPREGRVPAWLWQILKRGLSPDPAKRFPSMSELLAQLERDPATKRRRRWRIAGMVAASMLISAVVVFAIVRADRQLCQQAAQQLVGVWDDAKRQQVRTNFIASGRPYATETFNKVRQLLDTYASRWTTMHKETCAATRIHGHQSEQVMQLRMRCLDRRRAQLRALVNIFEAKPDGEVLDRAVTAVLKLRPLDHCADAEALTAAVPPPTDPQVRQRVDELLNEVAQTQALQKAGKLKAALVQADDLVVLANATDYAPLIATALYTLGDLQADNGKFKAAEDNLTEAGKWAAKARDDELLVTSWIDLVHVQNQLGHPGEATSLAQAAETTLVRVKRPQALAARLQAELGALELSRGQYNTARSHFTRALTLMEKAHGADSLKRAAVLSRLAVSYARQGEYDEAKELTEQALRIHQKVLGRDHPEVAKLLNNLGILSRRLGEFQSAGKYLRRALKITQAAFGTDHPSVAAAHQNLGNLLSSAGQFAEARTELEQALAITRKTYGPEHSEVGKLLSNLALVVDSLGDHQGAMKLQQQAVVVLEKSLGPQHPELAITRLNYGWDLFEVDRFDDALRQFEKAKEIFEHKTRPDHPFIGYALTGIGACRIAQGKPAQAIELLERALKLIKKERPPVVADTQFTLGRALVESGRDRKKGRSLVHKAHETLLKHRQAHKKELARVEAWLRQHP